MCWCKPNMRTPNCGDIGCIPPDYHSMKEKYNKLLDFIKGWSMPHLSETQISAMENGLMGLDNFQKGKNFKLADIALEARDLLKELGEL